jgi:hypothetical protein
MTRIAIVALLGGAAMGLSPGWESGPSFQDLPPVTLRVAEPGPPPAHLSAARAAAARLFASEVRRLEARADEIDEIWGQADACAPAVPSRPDFGREWFDACDVWAGAPPRCRSLGRLCAALRGDVEDTCRRARQAGLSEETIEGLLRWHSLSSR